MQRLSKLGLSLGPKSIRGAVDSIRFNYDKDLFDLRDTISARSAVRRRLFDRGI